MNVRISTVWVMKACAQIWPWFTLSSEGVKAYRPYSHTGSKLFTREPDWSVIPLANAASVSNGRKWSQSPTYLANDSWFERLDPTGCPPLGCKSHPFVSYHTPTCLWNSLFSYLCLGPSEQHSFANTLYQINTSLPSSDRDEKNTHTNTYWNNQTSKDKHMATLMLKMY